MLTSWPNFFFIAFEPGGSVTVDKPPLGFWLEAVSAFFLGVNGFALALPNAIAGLLSIPLLFGLVKKQFGLLAGLSAALVLSSMPITIAAERNNTIDGMLVFVLLLAAWMVWKSVESGQFRYLLIGILLVGLGFNIKMLQAYMVLPAFYGLYIFGSKHGLWKRIRHLGIATVFLLAVSLSWALAVDAVPANNRPFIGSSTDNTVMELIVGHNGIKRLLGGGLSPLNSKPMAGGLQGGTGNGRPMPPSGGTPGNQPGGPNEVGTAGVFRLFTEPLASQVSWLLPLALLGLVLTLFVIGRPIPLSNRHLALILWAGWLLPGLFYFSFTTGLWHTYYLIMLGPALAALAGASVWACAQILLQPGERAWSRHAGLVIALLSGIGLGYEIFILSAYSPYFGASSALMILIWLSGLFLLRVRSHNWGLAFMLLSLMVGPLLWSGLTTLNLQPEVNLPKAGPVSGQPGNDSTRGILSPTQQKVLNYLLTNTAPKSYLAATLDSHVASPLILATGRPVLTFGGFRGDDNVVSLVQLQELVANGKLRFILDGGNLFQKADIFGWVVKSCSLVKVPGVTTAALKMSQTSGGPPGQESTNLYDCK
jgi:4-amino-4-deoxy-L-arabinose transferase-like glycosyltransferase